MNGSKRGYLRVFFGALSLAASGLGFAAESVIGEHVFSHPDGFEIRQVAGPPLVDRPIEIAFDTEGRLYCTDSAGVNDNVQQQLEEKPHRVLRLEDTDHDGIYDTRTVFADRMMFPEGCLWHEGSLYVAAPPSIWKLTDTDGDGVADQREEWFQGKTLTGCANDLHGPYLGLDGRIYWTKGAFAEQHYEDIGGAPWETRAAHIFRARPNGLDLEPVMTGGMDNPVGVAFTPGGERIFTTTFFQHPRGGQRDGLVHAIYGGVYGKPHGVIEGHPRTGDLMPVLTHLGAAAPAGLIRYRSDVFGKTYQDNLFSVLFNMQRVMRHRLTPDGATFKSADEVFIESNNRNFHPTDVDEDADGSLLVVDTGGWYKLCCPTSQLPKPDVLGAIYRVSRTDATGPVDGRGRGDRIGSLTVAELLLRLDDSRPAVGDQVVARLGAMGPETLSALEGFSWNKLAPIGQRRLVWALSRIDGGEARAVTRALLESDEPSVRLAAIHVSSLHRDPESLGPLLRLLQEDNTANRRAAAEALGRLGKAEAVPGLLKQLGAGPGRVLEHSLRYALIEIGQIEAIAEGLDSENDWIHLGALVALDQLGSDRISGPELMRVLRGGQGQIEQTGRWILSNRPELAGSILPVIREWLGQTDAVLDWEEEFGALMVKLAGQAEVAALLGELLRDDSATPESRRLILGVMEQTSAEASVEAWAESVVDLLEEREPSLTTLLARVAAQHADSTGWRRGYLVALMRLSVEVEVSLEARLVAIGVLGKHLKALENRQFSAVREGLALDQAASVRSLAASAVQSSTLTSQQLVTLGRSLPDIGPLELGACLAVFKNSKHERIGKELVSGLQASPGLSSISPDQLRETVSDYPLAIRESAEELIRTLQVDRAQQRQRLTELLSTLPEGDVRRGQAVFNSEKAACFTCHEIGYLGGDVGPDLTRIGRVRTKEDLLEAVIYPSLSFVRSYEPYHFMTNDGDQFSGIIRDDDGRTVTLVVGPQREVKIARASVFEQKRSDVSVMPAGMDELLSRRELADLLAFLEATKW